MGYRILKQISVTPLKSGQLEIYEATAHGTTRNKIGVIRNYTTDGEFSCSVNSTIEFNPRYCVNEILFEQNITR